ncbi:lycopene beta-cyclase CrtY [Erwinia sp. P7711]|uniref:lycopene beta-cyclase CrtY n=1 Tax=Erwinia sp. P7711 TaxID=3141451 RepID=UPI0031954A90
MLKKWDLILAGGGLANGLIAWRMLQRQPALSILMLEAGQQAGGNHTWSFHQSDLTPDQLEWLLPLVAHRWDGYEVAFPDLNRTLPGGYLSLTSDHFAAMMSQALGENLRLNSQIADLSPEHVELDDGQVFYARTVIDGRGYQPNPAMQIGYQSFLGQQWQLTQPHGLKRPILMDATVDQLNGYRFVYTLPLTPDTLLIEDTHYIDSKAFDVDEGRKRIQHYAAEKGWRLQTLQREEQGNLPITLAGKPENVWQQERQQPCSGLRALLFHPTTGYSLPLAVALADLIASQPVLESGTLYKTIKTFSLRQWRQQRFFRLLNRMLFLAGSPAQRWQVMQRFYRLDQGLIARFYAGKPTCFDMARVLTGKPPVPVGEALSAVLKKTPRLRAF